MASLALLALFAAAPLPDGNTYVRGLVEGQRRREEAVNRYTYDVTEVQEELDDEGRPQSVHTARYEVFHVKGRPVRKKVAEDGRPIPGDERVREERRVRETVESIANGRNAAEREVRLSEVLERYDFRTVGREELDERATLVFDFVARPGERKLEGDRFLRVLAGRIWVDEGERELVRAELRNTEGVGFAWGLGPTLEALSLDLRFDQAEEGLWLPARMRAVAKGRLMPLKGFRVRITLLYGRYRRFETNTEESLEPPR
jgi:hypothetical protein